MDTFFRWKKTDGTEYPATHTSKHGAWQLREIDADGAGIYDLVNESDWFKARQREDMATDREASIQAEIRRLIDADYRERAIKNLEK